MKNKGCSLISGWIIARLPVADAACWNWKEKVNSFKIIIVFFFTPPLFLAKKVAISFVCYSPKTIKCTQKLKIEKSLQESTNRASERASECQSSTSYLQLALAHARNSQVKKDTQHKCGSTNHRHPKLTSREKRDINSGHVRIYS